MADRDEGPETELERLLSREQVSESENNNDSSDDYMTDTALSEAEEKKYKSEGNLYVSEQGNELRKRNTYSENDLSLKQPLKSFAALKAKLEDKLRDTSGTICRECFIHSIESHLCSLGIITPCDNNINALEEVEDNHDNQEKTALIEKQNTEREAEGGLLRSLHRRTLSEIDWHELTRFAQGELFDPESSTAKEIHRVIEEGKDELSVAFKMMHNMDFEYVVEKTEKCVQCVLNTGWRVVSHWELPQWLRDNDFLWHMHRPQLPSFKECFGSMFRIHTETGNIWTHFVGLILVVISMLFLFLRPATTLGDFPRGWEEYLVFGAFFIGAITCLMFSWLFHTCSCHSKKTSKLFSKLDYTGIACMIMGSYVPCIYYSFYCQFTEKVVYITSALVLGVACIIVALWDKFATPAFRAVRAALFLALGCSAIIPIFHMLAVRGFAVGVEQGQVGWMVLMGVCYIVGALLYAMRIPERYFPGKCNLVFQSHQIFHVLVVVAAFVHLHGCCEMALYRIQMGRNCTANP